MKVLNWRKPGWIVTGIVFLVVVAALVAVGVAALSGNNSKSPASSTGPAVSSLYDGPQLSPQAPDRVTLMGKIDNLDGTGLQLLAGPRYENNDRVAVTLDQNTKIVDANGQPIKPAHLKKGQEVTVETDPIETWDAPVKVKAYHLQVIG